MHNIIHAILLGILQGFTEFLPVSSSAHLILLPKIMGWNDFGLGFDIAIHFGSLIAIIGYFLLDQKFKLALKQINFIKLGSLIAVATIPVGICGLLFNQYIAQNARSISLLATTTIIFGLLLGLSYFFYIKCKLVPNNKYMELSEFSFKYALILGLAQAVAIIPGVSRSGITLTAGLFLGFNLLAASRLSFMMAVPVILAAGSKQFLTFIMHPPVTIELNILIIGFLSSMFSSLLFVFGFFKYIKKIGIWPFVIYRILLGGSLISCL